METPVLSYAPTDQEEYMNARQIAYFKAKLLSQKYDLEDRMIVLRKKLKEMKASQPDLLDRSYYIMEMEQEIQTQERHTQTVRQINQALDRIKDGSFGYCELTGEKIGIRRLEILPFTNFSIEAMERSA